MKSILRIAGASLTLAALAAISTPVFAGPARIELSFGSGYYPQQQYVQPRVVFAAAPVYSYQDEDWRQLQWRENAWRERERREHYWRERNEWRERQFQEQRGREHDVHHDQREHDRRGGWR